MNTSVSAPVHTTDRQGNIAYEVTVTYSLMRLRYRLHNKWSYGIDCRGAFADSEPSWYGTNMGSLDLPSETIAELRALWESLFGSTSEAAILTTPKYEEIKAAALLAVSAAQFAAGIASRLQTTAAGWCLLTLLANAAAKQFPERAAEFYEAKTALLYTAICHARIAVDGEWWAAPHAYGDYADTVVYIETSFARFAFHCRKANPKLAWVLKDAPTSGGGWSGLSLQSYGVQLVQGYLGGPETAAEIIARVQASEVSGAQ